jgi:hypothetical protein
VSIAAAPSLHGFGVPVMEINRLSHFCCFGKKSFAALERNHLLPRPFWEEIKTCVGLSWSLVSWMKTRAAPS